ncbi:UDP-2,4-diacetamido-2,4,6-trideoxy-beta-L-altropyranose hydrolase [Aliarcobacter cryaerophilus]|uniref:UDP-2,4-diacetamido-2,4, 6-trideoxy-beta-L-altropyranose hydrolase n=1 Tax=Aliarcobacter cryaerophilus TaxID=28198 RepID=UPI0021B4FD5A|nr:UDP-2,4-diacetamido-2,4,6-trideoxy-beta-L-altropyranose hydrolase [Aliarcobacter cryaerophilus]MCT7541264.1 UDP-2,4-diacetamido-2,4,6-trideoxy-beta-L-altropyranose hydrolase [Aliarcobacter cryaerophilus]
MNILIRADSSSFIGTGHIMRDLVLAKQYKSENIIFAVRELDGNINYKIDEEGYSKVILQTNDFEELDKKIKDLNIDMLVIDHYEINYDFEKRLKEENKNLKIFVFDDTYEKHHCDILLNHNISGDSKKYKDLVPKNCELRCGAKYTLLRGEFLKEKKKLKRKKIKSKSKTVFIAMGGADHSNINIDILKVIKKVRKKNKKNIKINIVSTNANKNLEKLKDYCKNKKWINLHINSKQIAKLMSESDFAIVTPSVTVNEVYYLELPIIAIKTAENQIDMYEFLKKHKYPVLNKFKKEKLKKALKKLLKEK